jgi:hypothetical protein
VERRAEPVDKGGTVLSKPVENLLAFSFCSTTIPGSGAT